MYGILYLHLVDFYGKLVGKYTIPWILWVRDGFQENVDLAEIDHGFPTWIFLKESDSHNVSTLLV